MSHQSQSTRATVDVINFWCVAVLVISAVSVAGVVGAAVVSGEFEDRDFNIEPNNGTDADVLIETNPDGTTRIRWSEKGEAMTLSIQVNGQQTDLLNYVGDEVTIESPTFEVIAIYEDRSTAVVESRG